MVYCATPRLNSVFYFTVLSGDSTAIDLIERPLFKLWYLNAVFVSSSTSFSLDSHKTHESPDSFAIDLPPSQLHLCRDSAVAVKGARSIDFVN